VQNAGDYFAGMGTTAQTAQAIAEGIQLALFQDNRFKSDPEDQGSMVDYWDWEVR